MKQLIIFILLIDFPFLNVIGQTVVDSLDSNIQNVDTSKTVIVEEAPEVAYDENDTILIENLKGDVRGYYNGYFLLYPDYKELFKNNPEALHQIKVSNSIYQTGKVITYVGGFVFGYCLGSAISGDQIDSSWWATLGVSAAVCGVGVIIYNSGKPHQIKAIESYNSAHKKLSYNIPKTLELGFTNLGPGIIYKF